MGDFGFRIVVGIPGVGLQEGLEGTTEVGLAVASGDKGGGDLVAGQGGGLKSCCRGDAGGGGVINLVGAPPAGEGNAERVKIAGSREYCFCIGFRLFAHGPLERSFRSPSEAFRGNWPTPPPIASPPPAGCGKRVLGRGGMLKFLNMLYGSTTFLSERTNSTAGGLRRPIPASPTNSYLSRMLQDLLRTLYCQDNFDIILR